MASASVASRIAVGSVTEDGISAAEAAWTPASSAEMESGSAVGVGRTLVSTNSVIGRQSCNLPKTLHLGDQHSDSRVGSDQAQQAVPQYSLKADLVQQQQYWATLAMGGLTHLECCN